MIRVGQGVDVHPFDEAKPLILGGIRISDNNGLAGHSDADAALHAITDALLGAAGAGDIGQYFPSDDPRWAGANSAIFIREAKRLVAEMESEITNVDVTIIAQKPKIAPFREAMRDNIAKMLDLPPGHVNVKATTTDHLGFIGRGEGICAMAIVAIATEAGGSPIEGAL
jgi:2-C-methyl-D-erythritol 2,4-cyclodiphosphate synthase